MNEATRKAYELWKQTTVNEDEPRDWVEDRDGNPVEMGMVRRQAAWENYCDHRDGLPAGTSAARNAELVSETKDRKTASAVARGRFSLAGAVA